MRQGGRERRRDGRKEGEKEGEKERGREGGEKEGWEETYCVGGGAVPNTSPADVAPVGARLAHAGLGRAGGREGRWLSVRSGGHLFWW